MPMNWAARKSQAIDMTKDSVSGIFLIIIFGLVIYSIVRAVT